MIPDYPLLRLFEFGPDDYLVYDARPHFAFILAKGDWPVFKACLETGDKAVAAGLNPKIGRNRIDSIFRHYEKMVERGVLLKRGLKKLCRDERKEVENNLDYFFDQVLMRKFILEVTEECNFRCSYCFNSMESNFRRHRRVHMSFETARTAIDFYKRLYLSIYTKLSETDRALLLREFPPHIGFYGGEPMLNFNVMRRAADYFKTMDWGISEINRAAGTVTVNTNLSLMNDEILDFLVSHDIMLFASLDGVREDHDRNRVTADGRGTFDLAYDNLVKIQKFNQDYFARQVTVFAVEAVGSDKPANMAFFKTLGCPFFFFSQSHHDCFIAEPEAGRRHLEANAESDIENKISLLADPAGWRDNIPEFQDIFFFDRIATDNPYGADLCDRLISCPMGVDNMMIGVDGSLHICHKTDNSRPFGNVHSGLDREALIQLYIDYAKALNSQDCPNCWAHNFCSVCGATRLKKGVFANPRTAECDYLRSQVAVNFRLFIELYRRHPDKLDEIFEYKRDLNLYKGVVYIEKLRPDWPSTTQALEDQKCG